MFSRTSSILPCGRNVLCLKSSFKGRFFLYGSNPVTRCPFRDGYHWRPMSTINTPKEDNESAPSYEVTFVKRNGEKIKAKGKEGDSLLDVVVNNNLDFDGYGACEGTLTCSTCHVILKKEDYERLPDKPGDEEMDMLDLAYELTDTSRLGCQISLSKDLDGLEVQLPSSINDARS